jgi:DNA repair protein RecO (recombination protein O)
MTTVRRVGPVAAYILHHAAYRDSGRILEVLTREHGRLSLFAHGVRRPKSGLAAALQPFQRLLISWSGRGEAPTLASAEIDPERPRLPARQFMSGCYVNELLLKLTTRHDSHPELFDLYEETLAGLDSREQAPRALRLFEKRLLEALGFGLGLLLTADERRPIDPGARYHFQPQVGAITAVADAGGRVYSGAALLALARETIADAGQLQEVKPLLRAALDACLEGRALRTRDVADAVRRARHNSGARN